MAQGNVARATRVRSSASAYSSAIEMHLPPLTSPDLALRMDGPSASWVTACLPMPEAGRVQSLRRTFCPDEALLLILTTALDKDNEYRSTVDILASRDDLSVEQKAKTLQDQECASADRLRRPTKTERAIAARNQRQEVPRTKRRDSNASDDATTCFCCWLD
ncbi:hypothetical protein E4U14_008354 [Claviceps sp. LM454 group G7]|nr:hypothetical protein E4U14_008354 [Claviceps sp. LM454 group G7]